MTATAVRAILAHTAIGGLVRSGPTRSLMTRRHADTPTDHDKDLIRRCMDALRDGIDGAERDGSRSRWSWPLPMPWPDASRWTAAPALLQGYAELPGNRPGEEEELLERDVQRFRRLLDVEKFLDRMDRVMDAATHRAVAYLGYRLKTSERIEEVIADTVHAVVAADHRGLPLEGRLLSPFPGVGDNRLRLPVEPPPVPSPIE